MSRSSIVKSNKRKYRVRKKLRLSGKLRLSVFRSSKHIYAQIIDDLAGKTLVSASSLEADFLKTNKLKSGANVSAAVAVGNMLAKRALEKKIDICVFDRGPYLYHGRIKAVAEAAREKGLKI